jgi:beta-phosphoglucomutase-like phosphatase (HAD superfamily)
VTFAAALFDMDGTLVDREPLMTAAVVDVMAATALAVAEPVAASWVGRSWHDIHAELAVAHHTGWDLAEWHGRIVARAEGLLAEGFDVRELEGGAELMAWFATAGVPVAVVTGSTHPEVDHVLATLGVADLVEVVVASGDYGRGKPDPEPFTLAARRLGVEPARCVAFEDSEAGIRSARAAGMTVVATAEANPPAGHVAHQDLAGADVVVPSLLAAVRWLEDRRQATAGGADDRAGER